MIEPRNETRFVDPDGSIVVVKKGDLSSRFEIYECELSDDGKVLIQRGRRGKEIKDFHMRLSPP